jgi:hypothetical protein
MQRVAVALGTAQEMWEMWGCKLGLRVLLGLVVKE